MREAAKKFEFEKAARLRDTIKELRDKGVPIRVIHRGAQATISASALILTL